jgi:tRNA A37 threonylcarbamoyltransferase TsaD
MLTEATERALAHLKARELLLTGGVGNNQRLQEMLGIMAREHNAKFGFPKNYCSDNGVMIAILGLIMYNSGIRHSIDDTGVRQKFRSDDVEILW